MAIVADYIRPDGARIIIHDDCCAYRTRHPEEYARRKAQFYKIADEIRYAAAIRALEEQKHAKAGTDDG